MYVVGFMKTFYLKGIKINNRLHAHVSKTDNCASTLKSCAEGLEILENIKLQDIFSKQTFFLKTFAFLVPFEVLHFQTYTRVSKLI